MWQSINFYCHNLNVHLHSVNCITPSGEWQILQFNFNCKLVLYWCPFIVTVELCATYWVDSHIWARWFSVFCSVQTTRVFMFIDLSLMAERICQWLPPWFKYHNVILIPPSAATLKLVFTLNVNFIRVHCVHDERAAIDWWIDYVSMISDMMHKMITLCQNWWYFQWKLSQLPKNRLFRPNFNVSMCYRFTSIADEMRWNLNLALAYDS